MGSGIHRFEIETNCTSLVCEGLAPRVPSSVNPGTGGGKWLRERACMARLCLIGSCTAISHVSFDVILTAIRPGRLP